MFSATWLKRQCSVIGSWYSVRQPDIGKPRRSSDNRLQASFAWVLWIVILSMLCGCSLANPCGSSSRAPVWVIVWSGSWEFCAGVGSGSGSRDPLSAGSVWGGITPGPSGPRLEGRLGPLGLSPEVSGRVTPGEPACHRTPGYNLGVDVGSLENWDGTLYWTMNSRERDDGLVTGQTDSGNGLGSGPRNDARHDEHDANDAWDETWDIDVDAKEERYKRCGTNSQERQAKQQQKELCR